MLLQERNRKLNAWLVAGCLLILCLLLMPVKGLAHELNTEYSGTILDSKGTIYTFTTPSNGYVYVTFAHGAPPEGVSFDWSISLKDTEDFCYWGASFSSAKQTDTDGKKIGLPAGNYSLEILCSEYQYQVPYRFTLHFVAATDWETEPNNRAGKADSLTLGTWMNGTIVDGDTADYYEFVTPDDGYITISFLSDDYEDGSYSYRICDRIPEYDDTQLDFYPFDDTFKASSKEQTSFKYGLPKGTHYLKLAGWSADSYKIKISFTATVNFDIEHNDDLKNAHTVELNQSIGGMSNLNNFDYDWFRFTLPEDGHISVTFGHDTSIECSNHSWSMGIYDEEENIFLGDNYIGSKLTDTTSYETGLPAGSYYVKITGFSSDWKLVPYHFTINYAQDDHWETEFNNKPGTADPVQLGQYTYGTLINSYDQEDHFQFTLPGNGSLSMSITVDGEESATLYYEIYDTKDQYTDSETVTLFSGEIPASVTGEQTTVKYGLPAGTHYIRFCRNDFNYHFKLNYVQTDNYDIEPNDDKTTSHSIIVNQLIGGIMYYSEEDWFDFTLTEEGSISISFSHDTMVDDQYGWTVYLYDNNSDEYLFGAYFEGNKADEATSEFINLKEGLYYACVIGGNSSCVVPYEFTVNFKEGMDEPEPEDPKTEVTVSNGVYTLDLNKKTATLKKAAKSNIKSLKIPDRISANSTQYKVTVIGKGALKDLKKLTSVTIGKNVKTIGEEAFSGAKKLKIVSGGTAVTSIGEAAFSNCVAMTSYEIGGKVQKIGNKAFYGCVKLKTVKGGAVLTSIGDSAFENCKVLESFTLNSKVKKIGKYAYKNCAKMKKLIIKTKQLKLSTVGEGAFTGVYKKIKVTCPPGKKKAYKSILLKRGLTEAAEIN